MHQRSAAADKPKCVKCKAVKCGQEKIYAMLRCNCDVNACSGFLKLTTHTHRTRAHNDHVRTKSDAEWHMEIDISQLIGLSNASIHL